MTTVVRFAPSPTGKIHIGNARTAVLNWLLALKTGGQFILRFDDTDVERSTKAFAQSIIDDLAWLGIRPQLISHQSRRFDRYGEAAKQLKRAGRLYAAFETPDELERQRKRQLARGEPPIYDRAALKLTESDRTKLESEGRRAHWRFLLDASMVEWVDIIRGPQRIDTATLSDPVLVREDGSYLYTLPSVVDDIDFGVTHVIRGEDHVVNAAVQSEIFLALGGRPPMFAHHSLLIGTDGKSLSKRTGSLSIAALRDAGLEAMAVVSVAALLGTSDNIVPHANVESLLAGFDLHKLSRAPVRFDEQDLKHLNAKLLHSLPFENVSRELEALGIKDGARFWDAVRSNVTVIGDARQWHDIIHSRVKFDNAPQDRALLEDALKSLPPEPWNDATWNTWTNALKEKTSRKGKELFLPLRRAITGLEHGPELAQLLPLIGRAKVAERLA